VIRTHKTPPSPILKVKKGALPPSGGLSLSPRGYLLAASISEADGTAPQTEPPTPAQQLSAQPQPQSQKQLQQQAWTQPRALRHQRLHTGGATPGEGSATNDGTLFLLAMQPNDTGRSRGGAAGTMPDGNDGVDAEGSYGFGRGRGRGRGRVATKLSASVTSRHGNATSRRRATRSPSLVPNAHIRGSASARVGTNIPRARIHRPPSRPLRPRPSSDVNRCSGGGGVGGGSSDSGRGYGTFGHRSNIDRNATFGSYARLSKLNSRFVFPDT
jgi:hypothetical protein